MLSIPPETSGEVDDVLSVLADASRMPTVVLTNIDGAGWIPRAIRDDAGFGFQLGVRRERRATFCDIVSRNAAPLVVDDVARGRFRNHAAVREVGVRSYVGVPFSAADGTVLGTLCACDRAPRSASRS